MSAFFKAGKEVQSIIGDWNENVSAAKLEEALGCEAMCIIHYKGRNVYLEMPDGSTPKGCEPVTEGQFMRLL